MSDFVKDLRTLFQDEDARYGYVEAHLNAFIASQIKELRANMSQQELAEKLGTKQSGVSRLENANYSSWKVETLRKLARAFGVRLRISFEEFGTLVPEIETLKKRLRPRRFDQDPVFQEPAVKGPELEKEFVRPIEEGEPAMGALFAGAKTENVLAWDLVQLGSDASVFKMKDLTQELAGCWQHEPLNPSDEVSAQTWRPRVV